MLRSRRTRRAIDAFQSNLTRQHNANNLKLGEKHLQLREFRLARASQVASGDVDDLKWIA